MVRPKPNKSKIIVLTDTFVGFPGGSERHLFNLLGNISERFDITAFQLLANRDFKFTDGLEPARKNVHFVNRPIGKIHSLATVKLLIELWQLCKQESVEMIASYHEKSDLIAYMVSLLPGINVKIVSSKRDMGFKLSKNLKRLMRLIMPRFNLVIAPSRAISVMSEQDYGAKHSVVVHNGVDLERFQRVDSKRTALRREHRINEQELVFICTAQFKPIKGHEVLLRAFSQAVSAAQLPMRLILLGDGELESKLRAQCDDLKISHLVHFAGVSEHVEEWLMLSDVSITATYSEGLSNALVESASSGLPIIATTVGGNPEVVQHEYNGLLVQPHSVKELSDAIIRMADDKEMRTGFGRQSRLFAQDKFSITSMVKNMEAAYSGLLGMNESESDALGVEHHG